MDNYDYYDYDDDDYDDDDYNAADDNTERNGSYQLANQSFEYKDEYNYLERVGGVINTNIFIQESHQQIDQEGVLKFASFVRTVAKDLSERTVVNVMNDIVFIEHQILKIPNAKFKNPTGYVIGYWVTIPDKIKLINENRFNIVKKPSFLKKLKYPLKDYDIIRYANLWITFTSLHSEA
jgi:hypothetical protein